MKLIIFFASIFIFQSTFAQTHLAREKYSAVRPPNVSWHERGFKQRIQAPRAQRSGPLDLAVSVDKVDLKGVTQFPDYKTIQDYFIKVRDVRFIEDTKEKMLRRITWMYPDDGCFARAALINEQLVSQGQDPLTKFYIFGNLEVQSPNATYGEVTWWYHVAAVVTDGKETYILDPAIEPMRPLTLKEWLGRLGPDPDLTAAVCHPDSYTPYSDCLAPDSSDKSIALEDDTYFLPEEKNRLKVLGRDWKKELGDTPPWLVRSQRPKTPPICHRNSH